MTQVLKLQVFVILQLSISDQPIAEEKVLSRRTNTLYKYVLYNIHVMCVFADSENYKIKNVLFSVIFIMYYLFLGIISSSKIILRNPEVVILLYNK